MFKKLITVTLLVPFLSNAANAGENKWAQDFKNSDTHLRNNHLQQLEALRQKFAQCMNDHFDYMTGVKVLVVKEHCYQGDYDKKVTTPLEINQHTKSSLQNLRYNVQALVPVLSQSDIQDLLTHINTCIQELELRIKQLKQK